MESYVARDWAKRWVLCISKRIRGSRFRSFFMGWFRTLPTIIRVIAASQYRFHGLAVDSQIPLPSLLPCIPPTNADVAIRIGDTPRALSNPRTQGACFAARPGEFLIWKEGVARFFVSEGREIVVEPAEGAPVSEIQRLLLSSPTSALLLQRGGLPLQASSVAHRAGAVLFVAGPCVGKSTLAMACCTRGLKLLADDLTVVLPDSSGGCRVPPAYPAIKLWPPSLRRMGMDPDAFPRLRPELDKRVVPCVERFETQARPVAAICFLRREEVNDPTSLLAPVSPTQGVAMLMNHVYRLPFAVGLGVQASLFHQAAALARSVRLLHATQPLKGFRLAELAEQIMGDVAR